MNRLLYCGDASERKGSKEFIRVARALGERATIISRENSAVFEGHDVYSFGPDEYDEMLALISQHKVAYNPSKNECPGLVNLECLQFMPVVLCSEYEWVHQCDMASMGCVLTTTEEAVKTVKQLLASDVSYDATTLYKWCERARQQWINITNGVI